MVVLHQHTQCVTPCPHEAHERKFFEGEETELVLHCTGKTPEDIEAEEQVEDDQQRKDEQE